MTISRPPTCKMRFFSCATRLIITARNSRCLPAEVTRHGASEASRCEGSAVRRNHVAAPLGILTEIGVSSMPLGGKKNTAMHGPFRAVFAMLLCLALGVAHAQ